MKIKVEYTKRQLQAIQNLENAFRRCSRWSLEFLIAPGELDVYPKGSFDTLRDNLNEVGRPYGTSDIANMLRPLAVEHYGTIADAGD